MWQGGDMSDEWAYEYAVSRVSSQSCPGLCSMFVCCPQPLGSGSRGFRGHWRLRARLSKQGKLTSRKRPKILCNFCHVLHSFRLHTTIRVYGDVRHP